MSKVEKPTNEIVKYAVHYYEEGDETVYPYDSWFDRLEDAREAVNRLVNGSRNMIGGMNPGTVTKAWVEKVTMRKLPYTVLTAKPI